MTIGLTDQYEPQVLMLLQLIKTTWGYGWKCETQLLKILAMNQLYPKTRQEIHGIVFRSQNFLFSFEIRIELIT